MPTIIDTENGAILSGKGLGISVGTGGLAAAGTAVACATETVLFGAALAAGATAVAATGVGVAVAAAVIATVCGVNYSTNKKLKSKYGKAREIACRKAREAGRLEVQEEESQSRSSEKELPISTFLEGMS